MRLFLRDGYAETSVADIAAESQVSRASVFRYCGSKSEIVWTEFQIHVDRLESSLRAVDSALPTLEGVRITVKDNLRRSVQDSAQWLDRFRVIDSDPDLRMEKAWRWGTWADVVAAHIGRRLGCDDQSPLPQIVATAVQAGFVSALRLWRDSGRPPESLDSQMDRILQPLCRSMQTWLEKPLISETECL